MAGDGSNRDPEGFGGFLVGHAAEVAELDDFGLLGVELGEPFQGGIEGNEFDRLGLDAGGVVIEFDGRAAVAFGGDLAAGMVDEDAADHLSGDGEEVSAVLPVDIGMADEAEEGFVDDGGAGQGVAVAFAAELAAGDAAEFSVDERGERVERGGVARAPTLEESG